MTRSIRSTLALSALIAGGLLAATAEAQFARPPGDVSVGTPVGSPGVLGAPRSVTTAPVDQSIVGSPNIAMIPGPGIGPGMRGGVGAPTDGLDSNPYAEAPQAARALRYPYRPPGGTSAPRTLN